jgi:hypothetical protein
MRAHVVLDTSSLAHAIAAASADPRSDTRTRRIEPDLANVVTVLANHGIEVTGVSATVASTPVWTGPETDIDSAVRMATRDARWLAGQRVRPPVPVAALPGAHNGTSEIGVDAVLVAGALLQAQQIRDDPQRAGEVVVVITHDCDLDHLPRYAGTVPLILAGGFDARRQRRLRRSGVSVLALEPAALKAMGIGADARGTRRPVAIGEPTRAVVPAPDDVFRPATAVVDAYGMMCSASAVLGVASLPGVESIRRCLAALGWPGDAAVFAAVPDIPAWLINELPLMQQAAWLARDRELDELALGFDADGDPSTVVTRGVLRPDRVAPSSSLQRDEFPRLAKRLVTQCAADLLVATMHGDVEHAVLVSDLPDLAWLTRAIPAIVGPAGHKITRVGARAAPFRTIIETRPLRTAVAAGAPFIVLPEAMLAQLVRIHGPSAARAHRGTLLDQVQAPDVVWTVVGVEPELAGVRLRSSGADWVEVALVDALDLGLRVGEQLDIGRLPHGMSVELRFDPDTPGLAPTLAVHDDRRPRAFQEHGVSVYDSGPVDVVGYGPDDVDVDGDHDGRPDFTVATGGELVEFRPGAQAVLGELANDQGTWILLSVDDTARPATLEWVEVLTPMGGVLRCRPADAAPGAAHGELWPPPGATGYTAHPGELVRAARYGIDEVGHTRWIALSSPVAQRPRSPVA